LLRAKKNPLGGGRVRMCATLLAADLPKYR
jgi:hypothetical protein